MASPHTAGIAALVQQAHPTWKPSAIKAALMSTADAAAIGDYDPTVSGTGLVRADRAANTVAYASTSDGADSLNFGVNTMSSASFSKSKVMRITNTSNASVTYTLSAQFIGPAYGATVTFTPSVRDTCSS